MTGMNEKRKGEVALALWRYRLETKGVELSPEAVRREVGNVAKSTGVPFDEIMQFMRELTMELFEKSFSQKKFEIKS